MRIVTPVTRPKMSASQDSECGEPADGIVEKDDDQLATIQFAPAAYVSVAQLKNRSGGHDRCANCL
jgi:hypothetical protein